MRSLSGFTDYLSLFFFHSIREIYLPYNIELVFGHSISNDMLMIFAFLMMVPESLVKSFFGVRDH